MRNAADARLLKRPAHRDRLALALTRAVLRTVQKR